MPEKLQRSSRILFSRRKYYKIDIQCGNKDKELLAHQNLSSLTRAVAVACIERILVYEDKTLEIEFTHMQDYAELLAQVQAFRGNAADGERAVV